MLYIISRIDNLYEYATCMNLMLRTFFPLSSCVCVYVYLNHITDYKPINR